MHLIFEAKLDAGDEKQVPPLRARPTRKGRGSEKAGGRSGRDDKLLLARSTLIEAQNDLVLANC
jgi:hypothetical protein